MKFLIMNRKEMKNFINKIHPFTTGIITISDTDKNNINITNVCLVDGNKLARNGVHSIQTLTLSDFNLSDSLGECLSYIEIFRE